MIPARPIVLDCDPGHDDALAILLAHGSPLVELLAITTVAGNQTLEKTTLNARRVCTVAGIRDVPVAAGCAAPLLRPLVTAAHIHGASGLDGADFDEPTVPLSDRHAVDLIVETVMGRPGEVTLVPTGPLTNIAMALRREPRIASRVREVVLMGGAFGRGNVTPAAEFNIAVDPEAAAVVFEAGWPLTMVGLDLTHQALATPAVLARIEAVGTPAARTMGQLLRFFRDTYQREAQLASPPVHDPCAVARVIRPELVEVTDAFVAVETQGRWTSGMTVTDFHGKLGRPANARVATRLDVDGFWELVVEALESLTGTDVPGRTHLVLPESLPPVEVDPLLIRQVLVNLLDNAGLHAPGLGAIEVEGRLVGDRVELRVADDGPGIAPGDRDRIFLLFRQAGVAGRAGIGLAIVKAFVEAHGERVWLEDRPEGACFAISLPAHLPAVADIGAVPSRG